MQLPYLILKILSVLIDALNKKMSEMALGDILVFLRRIATSKEIRVLMAKQNWVDMLMTITGHTQPGTKCLKRITSLS